MGFDSQPRPSEDVAVVLPHAVLLLDGATSLRTNQRSGGWYARQLADRLAVELSATPGGDLTELLATAIRAVADAHGLVAGAAPSSTVAMVRWDNETIDALVLADSPVVAFTGAGPEVLLDDRLAAVPRSGVYRQRLRAGGGYGDRHLESLRVSAAAIDSLRNRDGGFWVAEADPAAAYQAHRASWPRAEVRAVLVASDGVSCGVDDYRTFPDWSAVLDLATTRGPRAVLDEVRAAELSDPDGTRWARPKPHDDQALVLVDFTGD